MSIAQPPAARERRRIARVWKAEVLDGYGTCECFRTGGERERHRGVEQVPLPGAGCGG